MVRNGSPFDTLAAVYLSGVGTAPLVTFPGTTSVSTVGSGFSNASAVAVDGSGDVFVADYGHSAVKQIVATNGVVSSSSTVNTIATLSSGPSGVAVDGAGNVYVAEWHGAAVVEIRAQNGTVYSSTTPVTIASGSFVNPFAVTVDAYGNLYVADRNGSNSKVYELASVNGVVPTNATPVAIGSGFQDVTGVAVDASGNVFVADGGSGKVYEIVAVNGVVSASSSVVQVGSGFGQPNGIAVDAAGNLFVSDYNNHLTYEVVAVNGVVNSSSAKIAVGGTGFSGPAGLALDGSGHVFVSDYNNSNVTAIDMTKPPMVAFATATTDGTTDTADGTQTLTLANTGNATLYFAIPTASGTTNPTTAADFTFTTTGTGVCPSLTTSASAQGMLAAGASCAIPLTFTPGTSANGMVSESAVISDTSLNNSSAAQTVTLTGTGIPVPTTALQISGPTAVYAGTAQTFTVKAVDAQGVADGTYRGTVMLTSTDGSAGITPVSYTFTSGDAGVHAFSVTFNAAGSWTVTATDAADSLSATTSAVSVAASSFLVTTLTDDATATAGNCVQGATGTSGGNGNCSLRDAVAAANAVGATGTAGPVVSFLGSLGSVATPGVINVATGGTIVISDSMTINGLGANELTVEGGTTALTGGNVRVFKVTAGTATFSGITIANGGSGQGAGIDETSSSSWTIIGCAFTGNLSYGGAGGAIYAQSTVSVINSTFSNNQAMGGNGGAIYGAGGVTVTNSTFTNNQNPYGFGGAIYSSGAITVSDSTFSGNTAVVYGGAILAQGTATVSTSIFTGDSAGQGSAVYGDSGGTVTNVVYHGDTFSGVTVTNSVNGDPMLAPLGNYGGPTQTMLPLIGSVAICGDRTGSSVSADQRGVATSPFRYGQSNCYDVGAVETNYGLSFTSQPTDVAVNVVMSPAPQVTLTENGTVFTLASESLLVSDRANALTPFTVSTNSGIATLSGLVFSSTVTDKLNAFLQVRPALATQSVTSQQFQVLTTVTPSLQIAGPTTALAGVAQTFTVTVVDQLGNVIPSYTGRVMLSSTDGSAVIHPVSYAFTSADAGVKTFSVTFLTAGSQTVMAADAANSLSATSATIAVTTPSYLVTTLTDDASAVAGNCVQGATGSGGGNGNCSLRDAVAATNAYTAGQPVISFMSGLATAASPQVQTLTSAIVINQNVAITGPGANALTLSGNNSVRMFTNYANTVSINGLTMTKGQDSSGSGGAIFTSSNSGTLMLTGDAFTANTATAYGGALYIDQGGVVISGSTFSGNTAGSEGGAINEGDAAASLAILASTFSGNTSLGNSGAIRVYSGSLSLTSVTMAGNSAGTAGAIYATAGKGVTITNSIVAGNSAAGSYADYQGDTPTTSGSVVGTGSGASSTINPGLSALGKYGGTTQTMLPLPGSAAICAGVADGVATDQRGVAISGMRYSHVNCYDVGAVQTEYAMAFTVQPTDVTVGVAMSPAPTVTVTENGTAFTAGSVNVSMQDPRGMLTTSPQTANTSNGVATFGSLVFGTAHQDALTATALVATGIDLGAISNFFQVLAAPAFSAFTVTGYAPVAVLSEGSTVTVTAVDQFGHAYPGFTGTVTLSSSDGNATYSPSSYLYTTADNGTHTFFVTLNTLGTQQSITATSGVVSGSQTGIVVDDAIWVLSSNGGLVQLNAGGSSVATARPFSSVGATGGIAMDHVGTIWSVGISDTAVVSTTSTGGTGVSTTGGGVSGPTSVAVDGGGYIWVANGTGNTLSEFNNAGATQSMSGLAAAGGLSAPSAIVIDKTGGVWVANKTGSSVAHIFGGGKPVVTPLSTATTNSTLGIEP